MTENPIEYVCKRLVIAEDAKLEDFGKNPETSLKWGWGQKPRTQAKREAAAKKSSTENNPLISHKVENRYPVDRPALRLRLPKLDSKTVRSVIKGSCSLIKTVDDPELIAGIERRIKRLYEKGNTSKESLKKFLENECDLEEWQAERIINDQMNKYETRMKLEQFKKKGVKLVRWVHGGAHEPRPWHIGKWPHGLNGCVFPIDRPPVIDPKTGLRGYPGDMIGCHCHLEAIE